MLEQLLQTFDSAWAGLWGPFGILILCGFGLPIPEDIILIAAGALGADNNQPIFETILVMYLGIMVGDILIYYVGKFFGRKVLGTRFGRWVITEERLIKAEVLFQKWGRGVIFVARFIPGLRAPVFFSAGLLHFSTVNFLLMDGFAALLSAPFFVWLGRWAFLRYAENLDLLEKTLSRTKMYIGISALIVSVVIFYLIRVRSRMKNAAS